MKTTRTNLLCFCFMLISVCSFAQKQDYAIPVNEPDLHKPTLFERLPDIIPVNVDNLNKLLSTQVGTAVSINLSDKFPFLFEGQVVSAVSKYDNTITSVVIRSSNYPGAILSFSKVINTDRANSYTGRIISLQHGDLFELKNLDTHFVLVKEKLNDLVNE